MKQLNEKVKAVICGLVVTAVYRGEKKAPFNQLNMNHWRVRIRSPKTAKSTSFDYFGSMDDWRKFKAPDPAEIVNCWLSDAEWGAMGYREFMSNYGKTDDPDLALKCWRACRKMYESALKVTGGSVELQDYQSAFQDYYPEHYDL